MYIRNLSLVQVMATGVRDTDGAVRMTDDEADLEQEIDHSRLRQRPVLMLLWTSD